MQQYSFYYLLKEVKRKAIEAEAQAVQHELLQSLKISQPSLRQRLATVLVRVARWLDPLTYPSRPADTSLQSKPKC